MRYQIKILQQALCTMLLGTALYAGQSCTTQTAFATPDAAAQALYEAIKTHDETMITRMMGGDSHKWLLSGDEVIDKKNRTLFVELYTQNHLLKPLNSKRYELVIGPNEWPFAVPIVACQKKWVFDGVAGGEEVLSRRIGANELDTIQTLLTIVDAQREYATNDADGNGVNDYAQRFRSSEGKRDGLYWESEGEVQSPLGNFIATASAEGYNKKATVSIPYHGYYFKLLKSQSASAKDGAYSYMRGDKMMEGFAVLAYPAKYGSSGIMSFIVNHDGIVYQKDLGEKTAKTAPLITVFDPDKSWSPTK